MRKLLTLVLVLLFAAAAPLAWGQDDPGFEEDEVQNGDEPEVVADESGGEQVESDQVADGEELVQPEADEAVDDEPSESAEADESSAEQESFSGEEDTSADTTDDADSGEDMAESESGNASADDAAESDEASAGESAAGDESADAKDQAEEEEESEDSADDEDALETENAAEIADGEAQTSDASKVEGAGGNGANVDQPRPAPPAPAANPGGAQSAEGTAWPTPTFRFMVNFGTGDVPFQEVSGLDVETQVIEYRHPDSPVNSNQKMPGLKKFGNVTMKKGVFVKDSRFTEWYENVKMNTIQRTTVTIKLLDESGSPAMTWILKNAWPSKITGTDMKSDGNEVAVESIEIGHEGLTITK